LVEHLKRNYPGATYHAVYEAGFCGFWIQEALSKLGVNCIVVNPADVPTSDKEKKQKNDKVDSRKLVRSLRSNELRPIYIPDRATLQDRSLIRTRFKIVSNQTRCRNRIKSLLFFYGIEVPVQFEKSQSHWSKRFMDWLSNLDLGSASTNFSLSILLKEAVFLRNSLLDIEKQISKISRDSRYKQDYDLLISIPGVGRTVAMLILTELHDIKRFRNVDEICSFIGLIPNVYSSGEKESVGGITKRGNKHLRRLIIESAWMAVRYDPAMSCKYHELHCRMHGNKAIVRIARKLISRIRYVLLNRIDYQLAVTQ
jgi:transposase